MNRFKAPFFLLLLALLFASCGERQRVDGYFKERFDLPLPRSAQCSEYHTNLENDNDQVFAVEFPGDAESKAYLSKWRVEKGYAWQGELFNRLIATISGTSFQQDLLKREWSLSPTAFEPYVGKTNTGRECYVYLSAGGRRVFIFIPGA